MTRVARRPTPIFVRAADDLLTLNDDELFARAAFGGSTQGIVTMFEHRVPPGLQLPIVSPRGDFRVFGAGAAEVFSARRRSADGLEPPAG